MTYRKILNLVKKLKEDGGATFKNGEPINYKTGWQVATDGVEAVSAKETAKIICELGTCGVWLSKGIYYIDVSKRVNTKREAIEIGRKNNQQSVYGWARNNLAWC